MSTMTLLDKPLWMWGAFLAVVVVLLVLDLGVLNRNSRELTVRDSLRMSGFYILVSLGFAAFVWWALGHEAGEDFLNGYIIEKTLSMDNLFVMSVIFSFFAIPSVYQYRVLFWGILGVIILRGILIGVGAELVKSFEWTLYIFSVFLIFTGIKMLFSDDEAPDMNKNRVVIFLKRHLRVTETLHGQRFFIKQPVNGKLVRFATPLFLALIVVEFVDLIFALDSVPAIFAITTDTYVVYTSNIFAILGLRALYFALAAMVHRFEYLQYSLAALLIFIGGKIFIVDLFNIEEFPQSLSLLITLGILGMGIAYSLYKTKPPKMLD